MSIRSGDISIFIEERERSEDERWAKAERTNAQHIRYEVFSPSEKTNLDLYQVNNHDIDLKGENVEVVRIGHLVLPRETEGSQLIDENT